MAMAYVITAKRRGALRHTDESNRFDDFAIRQEWWTGETVPEAKVVRREVAGVPTVRWSGCPRRSWRNCSGTPPPQVPGDLAGVQRK